MDPEKLPQDSKFKKVFCEVIEEGLNYMVKHSGLPETYAVKVLNHARSLEKPLDSDLDARVSAHEFLDMIDATVDFLKVPNELEIKFAAISGNIALLVEGLKKMDLGMPTETAAAIGKLQSAQTDITAIVEKIHGAKTDLTK
jgi:hypothetical protein